MNRKNKKDLNVQFKKYIRTLIDKRNIKINNVFMGMIRSLNRYGSISETQWDCLVRFMVIDFNESPDELRKILGPLIGDKYQQNRPNTLERFFEQEEIIA